MTTPMRRPPSDVEREQAAETLQRACGDGRLTLEEFSARVGAVWAAEDDDALQQALSGLAATPIVGSSQSVDKVVTVFSDNKRRGRWKLRTGKLKLRNVFGATEIDLRAVLTDQNVIEISGVCVFGELKVIVPEGVEVDFVGSTYFTSRHIRLAAVPRVPGTPEIRIEVNGWFSSIEVDSKPYALPA
jgi:hypothetical protein